MSPLVAERDITNDMDTQRRQFLKLSPPVGGFPSANHNSIPGFASHPEASTVNSLQMNGVTAAGEYFWRVRAALSPRPLNMS